MTDLSILSAIDPTGLSYEEWLFVGMALKHEGGTAADWEAWSRRDAKRYHEGEAARKWAGFNGSGITAGTLVEYAKRQGWQPPHHHEGGAYDWDAIILNPREDLAIIDPGFVQDAEIVAPDDSWDPVRELSTYLSTLFEATEYVGYVTESWQNEDGKHLPKKGSYSRTAGQLLQELAGCHGDIGAVLGDYNPEVGAWIRFNPLDGRGVRDENVTSFRYALIESDTISIERQAAIYAELELPVAALVYSGKKSLHAIVRVGATSKEEYRDRVNFLHNVCKKNGLEIDTQNKNPSRLSRLPGVMRNGQKQYLMATNQGKQSWEEWKAYIEEANDNLPDFECLADLWNCIPPLANPLIADILREGHKLLLSGPSKAGKSYMLLQLAIAIAEGKDWLGWQCTRGKVLYVNLELDRVSGMHRLCHLYQSKGWNPNNINNIDIWNLRGKAVPLDVLAPKLIRRALKKRYTAIIIDPIYKVLTGSENEADDMAKFCNQFDKICYELGAATIYCHHHSKGAQGQRASRDRSSGSGVFARDPDAILDIIELNVSEALRKQLINRETCAAISAVLDGAEPDWRDKCGQDDALVAPRLLDFAERLVGRRAGIDRAVAAATDTATAMSGWRIEGTLREFAPFPPRRLWFRHPIHMADSTDLLADAKADGEEAPWRKTQDEKDKAAQSRKKERLSTIEMAYQAIAFDGLEVTTERLADHMDVTVQSVRRYVKEHPRLSYDGSVIVWTNEVSK